ncbi:MAG: twin-arginine translocation signal domain-containing protein [Bradyrhizobium sp.]
MERRDFLKFAIGLIAGGAALAAVSAQAAPLPPISVEQALLPSRGESAKPAVVSQDDVDRLKPEEVRWGHHGHHHWGHHHWHRHHWGHRHWHRHHWHHHRW